VAFSTEDSRQASIWTWDLSAASAARRLTFERDGHNRFPIWSADSQYVVFQSDRDGDLGLYRQRADNSAPAERLTKPEKELMHIPDAISPDGEHLLYNVKGNARTELWELSLKDRKGARFSDVVSSGNNMTGAAFSPDGHWVAYALRSGG